MQRHGPVSGRGGPRRGLGAIGGEKHGGLQFQPFMPASGPAMCRLLLLSC